MSEKFYTGAGCATSAPKHITEAIHGISSRLAKMGYTLRHNGTEGVAEEFVNGALMANGSHEIWSYSKTAPRIKNQHNAHCWVPTTTEEHQVVRHLDSNKLDSNLLRGSKEDRLKSVAKTLSVLGDEELVGAQSRSEFVVAYSPTITFLEMRVANHAKIPVFNIHHPEELEELMAHISQ